MPTTPPSSSVSVAIDRTRLVQPGQVIQTAWLSVWSCRHACRDRMAVGDVEAAYRRLLQQGDGQPWPCPVGHWDGEEFVIRDGRHVHVAAILLGREELLVAWVEEE